MGEEVVSQLKVTVSPVPTVSWDGVIVGFCGGSDERRRIYILFVTGPGICYRAIKSAVCRRVCVGLLALKMYRLG